MRTFSSALSSASAREITVYFFVSVSMALSTTGGVLLGLMGTPSGTVLVGFLVWVPSVRSLGFLSGGGTLTKRTFLRTPRCMRFSSLAAGSPSVFSVTSCRRILWRGPRYVRGFYSVGLGPSLVSFLCVMSLKVTSAKRYATRFSRGVRLSGSARVLPLLDMVTSS